MREYIANPWTVSLAANKFMVSRLVLGQDQYTIVDASLPVVCKLPAPEDTLGVNTYRANAFVRGSMTVLPRNSTGFDRSRGNEMVAGRWATDGGASFTGLQAYNEFWCVTLRDPTSGIYLQSNHPLAPGESVVIANRALERNVFVLEGEVTVDGKTFGLFKHLTLGQPKDYTFTNNGSGDAFIMQMYRVTPAEYIAAVRDENVPEAKYKTIPILSDAYWS